MSYARPNTIGVNIHLHEAEKVNVSDLNWFASINVTEHASIFVSDVEVATALVRAANEALAIVTLHAQAKAREAAA